MRVQMGFRQALGQPGGDMATQQCNNGQLLHIAASVVAAAGCLWSEMCQRSVTAPGEHLE